MRIILVLMIVVIVVLAAGTLTVRHLREMGQQRTAAFDYLDRSLRQGLGYNEVLGILKNAGYYEISSYPSGSCKNVGGPTNDDRKDVILYGTWRSASPPIRIALCFDAGGKLSLYHIEFD